MAASGRMPVNPCPRRNMSSRPCIAQLVDRVFTMFWITLGKSSKPTASHQCHHHAKHEAQTGSLPLGLDESTQHRPQDGRGKTFLRFMDDNRNGLVSHNGFALHIQSPQASGQLLGVIILADVQV